MLTEFKVRNYRNFRDELVLSLKTENNYGFSSKAISNGVVKDGVIVGYNASGKTNLGRALLDIVVTLTDKNIGEEYLNYTNLYNDDNKVYFDYSFQFEEDSLEYQYEKTSRGEIVREKLFVNNKIILLNECNDKYVKLRGAESLNLSVWENQISLVKYVFANTNLDVSDDVNRVFLSFMKFVRGMLMFSSAEGMAYRGAMSRSGNVFRKICEFDNGVKELEIFLHKLDIHYELLAKDDGDSQNIYCRMGKKEVLLSQILSSGTKSLVFFFYWYIQRKDITFVYIDEFDAFYHTDLSIAVVKYLLETADMQAIVSTHNTDIISNEILRPDCYFRLKDNRIKSFSQLTPKALREAHNLQKMYKAGAFNGEY